MPEKEESAALTVDLEGQGELRFVDLDDLERWFKEENEHWNWLRSLSSSNAKVVKASLVSQLDETRRIIDNARNSGDVELSDHGPSIKQHLRQLFANIGAPLKNSPLDELVSNIRRSQGGEVAASILACGLRSVRPEPTDKTTVPGAIEFAFFHRGLGEESVQASKQAVDALLADARKRIGVFKANQTKLQNRTAAEQSAVQELRAKAGKDFESDRESLQSKMATMLSEAEESLARFEETYDAKLALKAPVRYWSAKKKGHERQAKMWRLWLFIGLAVFLLALTKIFVYEPRPELGYETLPVLFLFVMPVLWALRILSRNLVSHLHLTTDAAERVAMIQTYLALLREKAADTTEHRALVLAEIFRSTATGFVKDETAPRTPVTEIVKAISGKQ